MRLFLHHVWKLHNLSTYIVLDRELQFIVLFTKKLYYLFGVKIAFSTAWHSQTDRKMEKVNQELK